MDKKLILVICLISLLILSKCNETKEKDKEEEEDNDAIPEFNRYEYFNNSLREYLVENKLLNSERVIKPKEMKTKILEIMEHTDPDGYYDFYEIFNKLTKYFVDRFYKQKKEIRGKDIFDLIKIDEITEKFESIFNSKRFHHHHIYL